MDQETFSHIRDKIIDYLSRQEFSEAKLLRKVTDLKRRYPQTERYRFYTSQNIQTVIEALKREGIINERRYAENVLRQLKDKKDGIIRIKQKMYRRLIAPEIITAVIKEFESTGKKQDYAKIKKIVLKKKEELSQKHNHPSVVRSRVYAFLAQKGYLPDDIAHILETHDLPDAE